MNKLVFVADVGGTTSRIALTGNGRIGPVLRLSNDAFGTLDDMFGAAVEALQARAVETAIVAVAGPVGVGDVRLTNRDWTLHREQLRARFGWCSLAVLNDFAAVAHGLPCLGASEIVTWSQGECDPLGPRLALGPGTGLGASLFWPDANRPEVAHGRVLATEAGHMSFGASELAQDRAFATLRAREGFVNAETVLSGPGLARLHAAMVPEAGTLPAATIATRLARGDQQTRSVVDLFMRLLGRFAGDLALAYRASGGVYLAGGVMQRIADHVDRGAFRQAFVGHPPYQGWLSGVPIHLVTAEEPGLIGCAALAGTMAVAPDD